MDCDGDGRFDIVDWKSAVASSLGEAECRGADFDGDGAVRVEELVRLAISLPGCRFVTPTPTSTATSTVTPSPTQGSGADQLPPTQAQALLAWLREGRYLGWHAESAIHPSGGPHFGRVRTYLNDLAFESLLAGNEQHPAGAAVIKELYHQGSTIQEWAVEIKLEADSAGGQNWYWYEGVGLSGRGLRICTGCHGRDSMDFRSKDFILTPFPLR